MTIITIASLFDFFLPFLQHLSFNVSLYFPFLLLPSFVFPFFWGGGGVGGISIIEYLSSICQYCNRWCIYSAQRDPR